MGVVLAVLVGGGYGYIVERGDFCFHSTWRGFFKRPLQLDLWRAYLLMLLISVPLVQGMIALGWIDPWIPPFAWKAAIVGGTIFGIGMVVGASCITGLFYKLGHGMLGTIVGLIAWSIGDISAYRGSLSGLRDSLNTNPIMINGETASITNTLGGFGWIVLLLLGVGTAVYLYKSPRGDRGKLWNWLPLGVATGLIISIAWPLSQTDGSNYTFGTSGVPTAIYNTLIGEGQSGGSLWIPIVLISIVPGAFIAAKLAGTLWVRGETLRRYAELAVGGLMMGIGAGLAGGCNLGHSTVGVSLLSIGSVTTTLSMIFGIFIADRAVKLFKLQRP